MKRKYWTLLVIDAASPRGLSPVQLQKSLFLISKNLPAEVGDAFYTFVPYNYGPFDPAVYEDASELVNEGFVVIERVGDQPWGYYVITPEGQELAHEYAKAISSQALDYIHRVVAWVQQLTFTQLLLAIYQAYPEYRVNSVFLK
jgi:uncharacterized protein YwgA